MLKASSRLSEYLTGAADDTSSMRINMRHMTLHMAWSGSPAPGQQADPLPGHGRAGQIPVEQARGLVRGPGGKARDELAAKARILEAVHPDAQEVGIHAAWKSAEARYRYYVSCPQCGAELRMEFDRIQVAGMR